MHMHPEKAALKEAESRMTVIKDQGDCRGKANKWLLSFIRNWKFWHVPIQQVTIDNNNAQYFKNMEEKTFKVFSTKKR